MSQVKRDNSLRQAHSSQKAETSLHHSTLGCCGEPFPDCFLFVTRLLRIVFTDFLFFIFLSWLDKPKDFRCLAGMCGNALCKAEQ